MIDLSDVIAGITKGIRNNEVANMMKAVAKVEPIVYPNHVHLHSDTRNLHHDTRVALPNGVQIHSAYLDIKRREHQTEHNVNVIQPGMISISKDVVIDFKNALDSAEAKGEAKGKKLSGFAELKSAANELSLTSYIDASTHGIVHVTAMADGKKYSSRDGVIIADLVIIPSPVPSNKDVAALISTIIVALDATTQEGVNKALDALGGFLGRDIGGKVEPKDPPKKEKPKDPKEPPKEK